MIDILCPACGALIEAADVDALVERSKAHTLDAHDYDIPREHVLLAAAGGEEDHGPLVERGADLPREN